MKALTSLFERGRPIDRLIRKTRAPRLALERGRALTKLDAFARGGSEPIAKRVLIDSTFDNPNYWLRVSIVRRAFGTAKAEEMALTGQYSLKSVKSTLQRLGIDDIHSVMDPAAPDAARLDEAQRLVASVRSAREFVDWRFECGLPASDVYDAVLRRQRRGTIDLDDPGLAAKIADVLRVHDVAAAVFDKTRPDILVISHNASGNTAYGAILWAAVSRGIDVIVPWGGLGELRFFRIRTWQDGYRWANVPTRDDIEHLSPEKTDALAALGRDYIAARLGGRADDVSAVYAYRRPNVTLSRRDIAARFDWDPEKPIIAVYASIWFDNPHVFGMDAYTDFNDWLSYTLEIANKTTNVNWLFKPHPSEFYYGGPTLADMVARLPSSPNVAVCPPDWNGRAVLDAVDAVTTLHGTVGMEATAIGRPVLVAGPGWYEHLGFVRKATSRDEFAAVLQTPWWQGMDVAGNRRRAEVFAGWYSSRPLDGRSFAYGEDHEGGSLWGAIDRLVETNSADLANEAADVRAWWLSGEPHYHTYRMRNAASFAPSLTVAKKGQGS